MREKYEAVQFVNILDVDKSVQRQIREMRNRDNIRKYMYTDHVISEDEHLNWLVSLRDSKRHEVFVAFYNDVPIGIVSLDNINHLHHTADWGLYIAEELKGKGIGGIVEYKLINYAFDIAKLEKLNCEVLETNPSVIKLQKKFGFVEEGIRRKNIIKDGQRTDVYLLGLLKSEWIAVKPKIEKLLDRVSALKIHQK